VLCFGGDIDDAKKGTSKNVTANNLPAVADDCLAMVMLTTLLLLASLLLLSSWCGLFDSDDVAATAGV
jgi:hypothetical protein